MLKFIMRSLVIWGTGSLAEMASFYAEREDLKVVAHVVDSAFLKESHFKRIPVIPDTELSKFPAASHSAFVAIGYTSNNSGREGKYLFLKKLGYTMVSIKSSTAAINLSDLPPNTLVMDQVVIEPFVHIGVGNIFWSKSQICHHSTIGDFNFFGPASLICGDAKIGSRNFFGGHSTLRDGISVGDSAVVGAHTYAESNVPSQTVLSQSKKLLFREKK